MNGLLEQAAAIVGARFAAVKGLAALEVSGQDPLKGVLDWKNNNLPSSTPVIKGFIFGEYDAETSNFWISGFTYDGVQYAWGVALQENPPAQGSSEDVNLLTYALNVSTAKTYDVFAFIANTGALIVSSTDWGSGSRIIGLRLADLQALTMIGKKVFTQMVTLNPRSTDVEFNVLTITKA